MLTLVATAAILVLRASTATATIKAPLRLNSLGSDKEDLMQMALNAGSDPAAAERLLARIWEGIRLEEELLRRMGGGGNPDLR